MLELPERDWKYMRGLKPELLDQLCRQINAQTVQILSDDQASPHESYRKAFDHIHDSDRIIADCFDDWRRSTLRNKLQFLLYHDLLSPEQYAGLTEETREFLDLVRR